LVVSAFFIVLLLVIVALATPPLLKRVIRRRLGPPIHVVTPDPQLPEQLRGTRKVAVVGGGLAGLTAAITLARRGFSVTVFESNGYLGGKIGSWQVTLRDGRTTWVNHGFHAFFSSYFNLNRFLDSMGLRRGFVSIGEYAIFGIGGHAVRFTKLETTPVFNLLALARAGVYKLGDALKAPGRDLYGVFLEYDEANTFARYDGVSFERFNQLARVSKGLRMAFNTFARAFFADADKLSLAELIKSFHFYYLSHDGGLVYDYPADDFEPTFLAPMRAELARHGAEVRLSTPVTSLEAETEGFAVNREGFDSVVMAADVVGASSILGAAQGIPDALKVRFQNLGPGQRYAVLRLWVDKDLRADVPVFVITDRVQVLDAVSLVHRIEPEAKAWAAQSKGAVIELHSYAVPDSLTESQTRAALLAELPGIFPEMAGFTIRDEVFQLKRDFTAFHVGKYAERPAVETGVRGLVCAGDWVKLSFPAMLMECACASGLMAANALLAEQGLRQEVVMSVPLKGLMAGLPQPPGRRILTAQEEGTTHA
jgi:carotenoid phi-ring synthase / carotenoid chi-ring synthase